MINRRTSSWTSMLAVLAVMCSCQSAYYGAMEQFGVHKRDILVDRVEEARDEQEEAKEQFQSALDRFSAVVGFDGGDLEENYEALASELEDSEERAEDVRDRIDSVESVAEALFEEWEEELEQYDNADLRRSSEQTLRSTRARYDQLAAAMNRAESKMEPVLSAFRDHVLFLKHNLNAQAITSLRGTADALEVDIAALISDMQSSIDEADAFIESMGSG